MDVKLTPTYEIEYDKIPSSILVGDKVGTLSILDGEKVIREVDLTVATSVRKANIFDLFLRYGKDLITGNLHF